MMRRQTDMDALERALASLPVHEPAGSRRARIRERAHLALRRPRFEKRLAGWLESVSWARAIEWRLSVRPRSTLPKCCGWPSH